MKATFRKANKLVTPNTKKTAPSPAKSAFPGAKPFTKKTAPAVTPAKMPMKKMPMKPTKKGC